MVDEEGIKAITIAPNPNIEIDTEHTIFDKPYAPFHLYPEFYSSVATQPRKTALMKYFKNQLVFGYAEEALTRAGLLTKEQVEAIKNTYREKNIRMSSGGEMISGLDSAEGQIDATVFTGFPRIDLEAYRQELAKTKTKVDTSLRAPSIFTDKYTEEDAFIDTAIRAHGTDNQTLDQDVYGAL